MSLCTHNPDRSLYNYFSTSVQCFRRMGPQFFCQHDLPSKLAESRYPPQGIQREIVIGYFGAGGSLVETRFFLTNFFFFFKFKSDIDSECLLRSNLSKRMN